MLTQEDSPKTQVLWANSILRLITQIKKAAHMGCLFDLSSTVLLTKDLLEICFGRGDRSDIKVLNQEVEHVRRDESG